MMALITISPLNQAFAQNEAEEFQTEQAANEVGTEMDDPEATAVEEDAVEEIVVDDEALLRKKGNFSY